MLLRRSRTDKWYTLSDNDYPNRLTASWVCSAGGYKEQHSSSGHTVCIQKVACGVLLSVQQWEGAIGTAWLCGR
jgi:hypothetical protein